MDDSQKKAQLKRYKMIATGLFVGMAVIFIVTHLFPDVVGSRYLRAFSEAAMIGALADWFAVVALFKHPLGLPIPHTNLIETNKNNIGSNLGSFISSNFLTIENIKPWVKNIKIAERLRGFLQIQKNRDLIIKEVIQIAKDAMQQLDDRGMAILLKKQLESISSQVEYGKVAGNLLEKILKNGYHEEWITIMAQHSAEYIEKNEGMVRKKVEDESTDLLKPFAPLIGEFLAPKITSGIKKTLLEFADDKDHPQRLEITERLYSLASEMKTSPEWQKQFETWKDNFFASEKIEDYSESLWQYIKEKISTDLSDTTGTIHSYLNDSLVKLADTYLYDLEKSDKLDRFVRVQVLRLVLGNKKSVIDLIGNEIASWDEGYLSHKLELEVGKDLQFIRVNGTLVGGVVGLLIYSVVQFFK